ncbi:MAG: hypothetical protein ABJB40_14210 [Acidobacteriota bacterium]
MKTILFTLFLTLFIFSAGTMAQTAPKPEPTPAPSPSPAPKAADISGKWALAANANGQTIDIAVEIKQTDDNFTGTTSSQIGNGTIEGGKVSGKTFTATLKADVQGQAVDFKMEGSIDGDKMSGTFSNGSFGSVPFTATKTK